MYSADKIKSNNLWLPVFLPIILFVLAAGCSGRYEAPVMKADSTIVYPSKKINGILARITFCRKTGRKTGKRIGINTIFTIGEKNDVYAFVDLKNCLAKNKRPLMFHTDWINPDGYSIFQKRFDFSPEDSVTTLYSSISIPPDKRDPGKYLFRVYLFRELIAEKYFTLLPVGESAPSPADLVNAKIILTGKTNDKTGEPVGSDSVYTIGDKGNVYAFAYVNNLLDLDDDDLKFYLDWIGPDGDSYFKKQFDLSPEDSAATLTSSISLDPDKRQPGICALRLYLSYDLVTEKKFRLIEKAKPVLPALNGVVASISICSEVDKKTGVPSGIDSVFTIVDGDWVHAVININNLPKFNTGKLNFAIEWIGPDCNSFYTKRFDLKPGKNEVTLGSAISLAQDKREPGQYDVRLLLFDKQIAESDFTLRKKE